MTVTFTGLTEGIWGFPFTPAPTSVFSITDENGGVSNRLDWGVPTAESFSNYVQYDGKTFTTELNTLFEVGELTYRNGTVELRSSFDGDFPLTVILQFDDGTTTTTTSTATTEVSTSEPALIFPPDSRPPFPPFPPVEPPISNTPIFDFEFNILNTPNETGDAVLDGDRLRFSTAGLSRQFFNYDGVEYTLELLGFSTDNGTTQVGQFNSPEESVAEATLYGRITRATSAVVSNDVLFDLRASAAEVAIGAANQEFSPAPVSSDNDAIALDTPTAATAPGGVLAGAGDDNIVGSSGNDAINGNQGNDTISGEAGNDVLRGGRGDDRLNGGPGNDILNGNRENDVVEGGDGNDVVRGGLDQDQLDGGAGDDILIGGAGADLVTGGPGADTFILQADPVPGVFDLITDFNAAQGDRVAVVCNTLDEIGLNPGDHHQDGIPDTLIVEQATGNVIGIVVNSVPGDLGTILCVLPDDPILGIS